MSGWTLLKIAAAKGHKQLVEVVVVVVVVPDSLSGVGAGSHMFCSLGLTRSCSCRWGPCPSSHTPRLACVSFMYVKE